MSTPTRVRLTREQAISALSVAGFPTTTVRTNLGVEVPLTVLMTAIGGAESDLFVDAQSPANSDGSQDNGWLQINSKAWPQFEISRLRSNAVYCAQAGFQVFTIQGVRAWYAYQLKDGTPGPYTRRMPPGMGGADVGIGLKASYEVTRSVQTFLNRAYPAIAVPLVVDGAFGPKSEAALLAWTKYNMANSSRTVTAAVWKAMGIS